jgi:hypothetical protein
MEETIEKLEKCQRKIMKQVEKAYSIAWQSGDVDEFHDFKEYLNGWRDLMIEATNKDRVGEFSLDHIIVKIGTL